MQKIQCPNCETSFKINGSEIPPAGVFVPCKLCKRGFYINKDSILADIPSGNDGMEMHIEIKLCPQCKLRYNGIDNCEYCGFVFKNTPQIPNDPSEDNKKANPTQKLLGQPDSNLKNSKRTLMICSLIFLSACIFFYTQFTIFVIQPIGALPEGRTLLIPRLKNFQFIDSADAMCARSESGVSLLCRGILLGAVAKNSKIYARFPYSEWLYLISTNGHTYSK
jgi:predicted Zn finger-like uncharacterized protein